MNTSKPQANTAQRQQALRKSNLKVAILPVCVALVFALAYVFKQAYGL